MTTPILSPDSLKEPPGLLIAVDPGLTSGLALFVNGTNVMFDQVRGVEKFGNHLSTIDLSNYQPSNSKNVIVYEDFRLRRGKALQQSGSHMEASQVIGMVKMWAGQRNWDIYAQDPTINPIAAKWSGTKIPKNHDISHQVIAYNHGVYWLIRNGMRTIQT